MRHCLFIVQISSRLLYRLLDCSHVTVNVITASGKPLTVRAKWHLYVRDLHHLTSISRMWDDGCMPGEDTHIQSAGVTSCRWGEVVSMDTTLKVYHLPGHQTGIAVLWSRIFHLRRVIAEFPAWMQQVKSTDLFYFFNLNMQASAGTLLPLIHWRKTDLD